jgi:hypothetical protein
MPDPLGWAVARFVAVEPAGEALERAGYQIYVPKYKRRLIGVRIDALGRRVRCRGLGSIVSRPLFPTYVLVSWPIGGLVERPIAILGGYILRYARDPDGQARPKLISIELVDELRRRVAAGEFDQLGPKPRRWVNLADPALLELLAAE